MILIVDDVPEIRMLQGHMLRAGNLSVMEASSAEEAYRILEVERQDGPPPLISAILMDIQLPGVDGIEATCVIKANPRLADIPILVVSAREDDKSLVNAFMAGAVDYVTKPASQVQLLTRVRGALRLGLEIERRREREVALEGANAALRRDHPRLTGIDLASGLPDLSALPALAAARRAPDLWLLQGEIDSFNNLVLSEGQEAAALAKRRVLAAVSGVAGQLGDQLLALPDGGFALLLQRAAGERPVEAMAEALRHAVTLAALPHPRSNAGPHITISIGYAGATDIERRAADALEEAKAAGGDRCIGAQAL